MTEVINFVEYAKLLGIDIKTFDDEDGTNVSVDENGFSSRLKYISKNVLESCFLLDPIKDFGLFDRKDHHKINGFIDEYVIVEKAIEVIKQVCRHPVQYNCQLAIAGLYTVTDFAVDNDLLKKYKKKEETYILAAIYAKYGREFRIYPQYKILGGTYKTDGVLTLIRENVTGMYPSFEDRAEGEIYPGGILIEHDEKDHSRYDAEDEKARHNMIKTHRYSLVRSKTGDSFDMLCRKIDFAKQEQEIIYSSNINPDRVWKELQNNNIEADFFSIFKKCLNPDEKYCISSEDLSEYLGMRNTDLKRRHIDKLMNDTSEYRIEFSDKEFCAHPRKTNSPHAGNASHQKIDSLERINHGRPKKLVFMSVIGMQLVMMNLRGNAKATKAQLSLIKCYQLTFKLALSLKNKVAGDIAKTKEQAHIALEEKNDVEKRKLKKKDAKIKIIDQKYDENIDVLLKNISDLEKEAKSKEKIIDDIKLRMIFLEQESAEKDVKIQSLVEKVDKYKIKAVKYKSKYTEMKTIPDTKKIEIIQEQTSKYTKVYINNKTIKDIHIFAKDNKITGYSKYRKKDDLVVYVFNELLKKMSLTFTNVFCLK